MRHLPQSLTALAALAAAPVLAEGTMVETNVALVGPGDAVPVARIPDGIYLRTVNDPDDNIWDRLPEYRVEVSPAPPVHPSVALRVNFDQPAYNVYFTPARTSDRFYTRLRWQDPTRDAATRRDAFRDGAAVQFALGDDQTSYVMGTGPDEPVNIWYWRSDTDSVQSLGAGGPGSTTPLDDQPVTGAATYEQGTGAFSEWTLVMSRPVAAAGDHQVDLARARVPLAFAVWQGSDGQRDGLKSVSTGWVLLDMGEN